jgi:hypothetical protein
MYGTGSRLGSCAKNEVAKFAILTRPADLVLETGDIVWLYPLLELD